MNSDLIGVVYPAVEFDQNLPKSKLRELLSVDDNAIIIGSIGALRKDKGFEDLITAVLPLARENKKCSLGYYRRRLYASIA